MPPASEMHGLIGGADQSPVPLQDVTVAVSVNGFVAHTTATFSYCNDSEQTMDVVFRCPVGSSNAVYRLTAELDGRTIVATIMEKKQAEAEYSKAVKSGKTAALMREESSTSDVVSVALGNLPAKCNASVKLCIVGGLKVGTDGGVQYTLPTALNPRYCPPGHPGPDTLDVSGAAPFMLVTLPYTLNVSAEVVGGHAIARVVSHSDQITVTLDDNDTHAKITQDAGHDKDHDWSFVMYYQNPYQPHVLLEAGDPTATGLMRDQVLMINMFPELPQDSYSSLNEVIFVVDRSGSMCGDNIQSARAVLLLFLKSLPPGCYFNIYSFGNSYSKLFPESSKYTKETLSDALDLHKSMEADMGGTEVLEPLKDIYKLPLKPHFSRQILLLTDGMVFNVDQVTSLASRYAGVTRVFTVGIGDGASTALVEGLARAGRGRSEMVTQRDRIQTKVMGLVQSMLQSSVSDVTVSCEVDTAPRLHFVPPTPPVIFGGTHLATFARMPPGTQLKSISLSGCVEGVKWVTKIGQEQMKIVFAATMALHRLAARAQIQHYQTFEPDEGKEEVVSLSLNSSVLSKYTAMVAVDQDGKTVPQPVDPEPIANCLSGSSSRGSSYLLSGKCSAPRVVQRCFAPRVVQRRSAPIPKLHMKKRCAAGISRMKKSIFSDTRGGDNLDEVDSLMCDTSPTSNFAEVLSENSDNVDIKVDKEYTLMQLVSGQSFDGSWTMEDLAIIIGVDASVIKALNSLSWSESVLGTSLAVVLLQTCYRNRRQEWLLMVNKATMFLADNVGDGGKHSKDLAGALPTHVEDILAKSKEITEKLRSDHPELIIFS